MKITIDTKEDSAEEIKKAIQLLSALIQGRTKHSNLFEDDTPVLGPAQEEPSGNAFADMFGGTSPPIPEPEKQEEKEEDTPKVIEY
jgi:hypothetical protein